MDDLPEPKLVEPVAENVKLSKMAGVEMPTAATIATDGNVDGIGGLHPFRLFEDAQ